MLSPVAVMKPQKHRLSTQLEAEYALDTCVSSSNCIGRINLDSDIVAALVGHGEHPSADSICNEPFVGEL